MKHVGYIELPQHIAPGGYDHAAVHGGLARMYVAHTANNALEVIDTEADIHLDSIPGLAGVAGALVSESTGWVFTSNRGENSVGMFQPGRESAIEKVAVGLRPNGLAFDAGRGLLLSAHVGDPAIPGSYTVALVDVGKRKVVDSIPVPGRTRWTIFDPVTGNFYVNIASPAGIVLIDPLLPGQVVKTYPIPAEGPHGLDWDEQTRRLFCACDGGSLFCLAADSGEILCQASLSGKPDAIFFNANRRHLYVAIGDPGMIEVFDTKDLSLVETVTTELGAHTLGFDHLRGKVYALLPGSHRAAVYTDLD